jgi:5'-3' exonuclease
MLIVDGMHTSYRANYAFPLFLKNSEIREIDNVNGYGLLEEIELENGNKIKGTLDLSKIHTLKELGYTELRVHRPVNLVYTFLGILSNQMNAFRLYPQDVVVVWEGKENFKKELDVEYKSDRASMSDVFYEQIEDVRKILSFLDVAQICVDGYEADDLIGTAAHNYEAEGQRVLILSSDHDMWQLISENIQVIRPDSGEVLDVAWVQKKYGGLSPKQLVDVWSISGDATDRIAGIAKGIGEGTAAKWIRKFGSLDAMFESTLDGLPEAKKQIIRDNKDRVLRNRELIRLDRKIEYNLQLETRNEEAAKSILKRNEYSDASIERWLLVFSRVL